MIAAIDKLSYRLREQVGESLRSVRADPPLHDVTTSSLEALRLYAEADREENRSGYDHTIFLMERAVALDSTFAMAWRRIGVYATNPGQGPLRQAMGDSAVRRAYALRERLPDRERAYVEGAAASGAGYLDGALAVDTSLIEKYPNDPTALNNVGTFLDRLGRKRDAQSMLRRAIATRMAPALTYSNAVSGAVGQGRLATASTELRSALRIEQSRGQMSTAEADMLAEVADIERTADYTTDPRPVARRLTALWEANRTITAARPKLRRRYQLFTPLLARVGNPKGAQKMMDEFMLSLSERDYPALGAHLRLAVARAAVAFAAS